MLGINHVVLVGEVASTPHFKVVKQDTPRMWLRVRTDEPYRDRESGMDRVRRAFHTVVVWGEQARALSTYLREGHRVCVEGRLSTSKFEPRGGKARFETEVVAQRVAVLGAALEKESSLDAA